MPKQTRHAEGCLDNFLDAKTLLEKNSASIPVSSPAELSTKIISLLQNPKNLKEYGEKAHLTVSQNSCVAEKHTKVILNLVHP